MSAYWQRWACHGPVSSTAFSQHSRHRAGLWGQPSGTPGCASCSPLLTFSLSSAVCMLCGRADVDPNICGHMIHQSGIHVHWLCLVSSPMGSFLITARGAPFLPVLRRPCSFPSYRILPAPLMKQERHGREVRAASLLLPSDVQPKRQPRR